MSERWFNDVLEFRRAVGLPVGTTPKHLPDDANVTVIREEYAELMQAIDAGDLPQIAKESADLIVTVVGNCQRLGIDLRPVWDAVHRDNMAKVGGPVREDGKRLKPPGFVPSDYAAILDRQPPIGDPATAPDAERRADEWIDRNEIGPGDWKRFNPPHWAFYREEEDEIGDATLPSVVFSRLKQTITTDFGFDEARYATRQDAMSDLRQALESLYRDGITPPELVTPEG